MLLILSVCAAGLLPPWIAVNARLMGLAPRVGGTGGAVTVKETGIAMGGDPGASAEGDGAGMGAHG